MRLKRIVFMVTVASLLAGVFAPAALAVDRQCTLRPCEGTNDRDTLYERGGRGVPDIIYGLRGNDRIFANLFGADRDVSYGGRGNDRLNTQDRRSEEHTSELQSRQYLVCRLLLEK